MTRLARFGRAFRLNSPDEADLARPVEQVAADNDRQQLPLKMRPSFTSAALTAVLGVGSAAAVIIIVYFGLRPQVIPRLPLAVLVLVFPLSALVSTLGVKWRHPEATKTTLTAYFVCILLLVFFATLAVLPPEF